MDPVAELENLLKKMDVPVNRTRINLSNLRWLDRNLMVRNSGHPSYERSIDLVHKILREKLYTN